MDSEKLPFGDGSVCATLYTHGLPARDAASWLVEQAVIAERFGFDGVTVSEHHGGLFEYLPNPLVAAGWILAATKSIWAGPCPLLLSLRPPRLVAEDIAWMAARYPGRVGAVLGPGSATTPDDFAIGQVPTELRRKVFGERLPVVAAALRGEAAGPLGRDPAIQSCVRSPVACLSTVGGPLGARRAGRLRIGIVPSSACLVKEAKGYIDEYHAAGGTGPTMLERRAWYGVPDPRRLASLNEHMAKRSGSEGQSKHFRALASSENPEELAAQLAADASSAGARSLNIKFFYPDLGLKEMAMQLECFGREVVPRLKHRLAQMMITANTNVTGGGVANAS